ncbi:unnamed protein product [Kuraishia capsulata CBS 1993]|uniref:protein-tyrosine-phosphatase n=1 Tax=Kuraishia capsulata CBS 1993 TaxID=1382522 RepID=W6MXP8_9ASCO|nr:uncharacterized protein KUCA_T00005253001 [Kuraishia capsulata CBS 1993]CDK29265.1 unnamed protein product [Kuraishia capsulata CBS 1993]
MPMVSAESPRFSFPSSGDDHLSKTDYFEPPTSATTSTAVTGLNADSKKRPLQHPQLQPPRSHQKNQDSLSSVNTEYTLVDDTPHKHSIRTNSVCSNDTLFERAPPPAFAKSHRPSKSEVTKSPTLPPSQQHHHQRHHHQNSDQHPQRIAQPIYPISAIDSHFPPPKILVQSPLAKNQSQSSCCGLSPTCEGFSPLVRKHSTQTDALQFRCAPRFKDSAYDIPVECSFLDAGEIFPLIRSSLEEVSDDGLPNVLLVDVRPFPDYCKSHIEGAVNVCLPSTLLKRPAFSLERCIATLTSEEKLVFTRFLERGESSKLPTLILYDSSTATRSAASLSVSKLASKFVSSDSWDSEIVVLKGGFREFQREYPNLLGSGSPSLFSKIGMSVETAMDHLSVDESSEEDPSITPKTPKRSTLSAIDQLPPQRIQYRKSISSSEIHTLAPIRIPCLSRFVLPDPSESPLFKSRHNEELLTARPDASHVLASESTEEQLPPWLESIIGDDRGAASLAQKFHNLQLQERERLTQVLSRTTAADNPGDSAVPYISSGIELGRKNRYKDIIPYEHSRVKLFPNIPGNGVTGESTSDTDYINASYLSAPGSDNKYIATQGPLAETIGDFWRVVVNHNTSLVLSLTPQKENEVEKCAPFWVPGLYKSDGFDVQVSELEQTSDLRLHPESDSSVVFRRLLIHIDGLAVAHEVLQVHVLSWPDYGAKINTKDLLSIVALKRFVSEHANNSPVVVHCSAGCGRTGVLCAIDTAVDILLSAHEEASGFDPVFDTVMAFRNQRISMVQNLRQYMLIYDAIILFFRMHCDLQQELTEVFSWGSDTNAIIKHFVADLDRQD